LSRRILAAAVLLLLTACSGVPHGLLVQPTKSTSAGPGSIDAFVPEAMRFVESHRGLKFKHTVKVQHLSDQAFSNRVIELQRRDRASFDRQAKVLRALGLIPPGVDPDKAMEELLGSGVLGFYDPSTKELQVRGNSATVCVKHVVVHELTHAMQDQWFSLNVQTSSGNDDADTAYITLVEGDAVRIESAYIATLSAKDRQALSTQCGGGLPPSDVPQVLVEMLSFPYVVGPAFTRAILQAQGQKGLDAAFRNHPAASSQVLHPDRFLNGDKPQSLPDPGADGQVFDRGTIGELGFDILLHDLVQTGALSSAQFDAATKGWAGDRYVAWSQGDRFCVRDRVSDTGAANTAALLSALRTLASSRPGVTVEGGSQPVLTSCA
jgi:hypothetical protein